MESAAASRSTAGRSFASCNATTSAFCSRSTRAIASRRPSPPFQMFHVRTRVLLFAREIVRRLRCAAVAPLAIAEEARQLGGERLAREVLLREIVASLLELLDVCRSLRIGRHGLAHLLGVRLRCFLQLGRVDRGAEERAEPVAERQRSARARRERDE